MKRGILVSQRFQYLLGSLEMDSGLLSIGSGFLGFRFCQEGAGKDSQGFLIIMGR